MVQTELCFLCPDYSVCCTFITEWAGLTGSPQGERECKASETSSAFIKNMKAFKHASYPRCSEHISQRRTAGRAGLTLPGARPPSSPPIPRVWGSVSSWGTGQPRQSPGPGWRRSGPPHDAALDDVLVAGGRRRLRLLGLRRVQPGGAGAEQGAVRGAAPPPALPALVLLLQVAVQGRRELLLPPRRLHKGRGSVGWSAGQGFFIGGDGAGVPRAARGQQETQQSTPSTSQHPAGASQHPMGHPSTELEHPSTQWGIPAFNGASQHRTGASQHPAGTFQDRAEASQHPRNISAHSWIIPASNWSIPVPH